MTPPTVVLAYHALGAVEQNDFARAVVSAPETLEELVAELRAQGYRFVSAGELVRLWRGARPPAGLAALTFDDGWRSDLLVTAPLLERLRVPATFFLAPGLFGNRDERLGEAGVILTETEARELASRGVELASHTMTHPDVRRLDASALAAELVQSKREVERISSRPCELLAWPFGLSSPRAERAAREAGFSAAFAFRPGPWRRFAVPRRPAGAAPAQYAAK